MHIPYTEFYITNVCNLNCDNCNRFNNFNFSGHSLWKDHADTYKKWSKRLTFNKIGILGGEPLINPDFMSWLEGISNLWPDSEISIITNGSQLHRHPELYNYVAQNSNRIKLTVNFHGFAQQKKVTDSIKTWLQEPITQTIMHNRTTTEHWQQCWDSIKDPDWPACNHAKDFINLPDYIQKECLDIHNISLDIWENQVCQTFFSDANRVRITAGLNNSFNNSTVIFDPNSKKLTLNNSDPKKALEICYSKKCHHFIGGKLYKCGPIGILPDFIQQFQVEISDSDRRLIHDYVPASVDWDRVDLEKFVNGLNKGEVIPQCKLCPESMTTKKFEAGNKKIKLSKIKPLLSSVSH